MSQHTKHGCDHIFFIGFLGAGKSTLARNVGTCSASIIDTDRLVAPLRQVGDRDFETEGEDRFASSRPRPPFASKRAQSAGIVGVASSRRR
ncbi:MAG: hypothetical protein ACLTYW_01285 [Collinsella sp.]